LLDHDAPLIGAILGTLKAGHFYVPLDASYPRERQRYILEDSQARLILTDNKNLNLATPLGGNGVAVLNIDELDTNIASENLPLSISPDSVAYILYTSGSTGRPKGVFQAHRNVLHNMLKYTNSVHLCPADRLSLLASAGFSASVTDILGALLNGASIFPFNLKEQSLEELADWLVREEITVYHSIPSIFRHLGQILTKEKGFPKLRLIKLGGEAVYRKDVELYRRCFADQCILYVGLGATEMGIIRLFLLDKRTEFPGDTVPIGYGTADTEVLLLDENGEEVRGGEVGEIAIRSEYLFPGYWRNLDLTRQVLYPDPRGGTRRVYRSGDLGRLLPGGCLVHMGRKDSQVKIRGYRIEIAEVERALMRIPRIQESVVVAHEDQHGDKSLVAYLTVDGASVPSVSELKGELTQRLPDYMIPSAFVFLDSLPLTSTGKVDRLALPAPDRTTADRGTAFVAPRTEIEKELARIWEEVLGVERVGVKDNFFELGGHSLLATQVFSRIRSCFRVELPLSSLFAGPTVGEIAERIAATRRTEEGSREPPLIPVPRDGPIPLSFVQQRLWFLAQLDSDNPFYNTCRAVRISGPLRVEVLQRTLDAIVARHESLRTTFVSMDGSPVQRIAPAGNATLSVVDLEGVPRPEREAEAQHMATEEARRPFDLARGPLLRTTLLQLSEEEHILLLTIHHIVFDGWSIEVFFREMAELWEAFSTGEPSPLSPLPIQYADFAVWQREWLQGEVLESRLSYWKHRLQGAPSVLELPTDRPRPAVQHYRGARESFELPRTLAEALHELSRGEGVTLFMTLLAAFQTLLFRYTGQDDIVVGSPIANRDRTETEGLIGFFINTLVLRADLSGNPSFRELLKRVKEVALGAYAHQDVPFEELMEELHTERSLSYSPLFQVMFILQNTPRAVPRLSGLTLSPLKIDTGTAKFDLLLSLTEEANRLRGLLSYDTDLFDAGTMRRMLGHFQVLLKGIVADPDDRLGSLPILTDAERHQMLVDWNDTEADYPKDECIHEFFEAQVERTPDAIGIVMGDEQLTYRELNARANQLAHFLREQGVGPEVLVGICMERSLEMVVGLLGILKAGGAYVPLDPTYPRERLAFMLGDTKPPVLVTQERLAGVLPLVECRVIFVDSEWGAIGRGSEGNPASEVTAENLAYVIYTSGSTGKPKGVEIPHRALVNFTTSACEAFALRPGDRILQFASISFDTAAEEIFTSLARGATLVLRTDSMLDTVSVFLQKCRDWDVTALDLPTAYWHELVATLSAERLALPERLRLVIVGGDRALPERLLQWQQAVGQRVELLNTYGPTEATVVATMCKLGAPAAVGPQREVPIGRPIRNVQAYVLDRGLQPVPIGVAGELHLGGAGLARGYLNRPDLTAERFIPDPFSPDASGRLYKTGDLARYLPDGNIEFLGRLDHQVKIRGYRVELGEIEAALDQHPGVRQVAVLAREDTPGDKRLVAYVVANPQSAASSSELRNFLKEKLPEYMLPLAFVLLDALP
ncbi:MAG: amino acid adenylation domain-containing protein, partial [Candidatus Methylomirabilis sp.]